MKRIFASWPEEAYACMDYLHGLVIGDELEAACYYEYGRVSAILRYAAELRKRFIRRPDWGCVKEGNREIPFPGNLDDQVAIRTVKKFDKKFRSVEWIADGRWSAMWQCTSFPRLPWNQLGKDERKIIAGNFARTEIQPLRMWDVVKLQSLGVFRQFNTMVASAREARKMNLANPKALPRVYPVLDKGQWVHALFTVDFSKTAKQLDKEFRKWLEQPENKKRFKKYRCDPTGKTGDFKSWLKDIAVWRLHENLGFDGMLNFAEANRKRFRKATKVGGVQYKKGDRKPFHDARQGQSSRVALNEAPLFRDEPSCRRAIENAKQHLAALIPAEFGSRAKQPKKKSEFERKFLRGLKEANKISKSSS